MRCQSLLAENLRWCSHVVAGHDARDCCIFGDMMEILPYGTLRHEHVGYSQKLSAVQSLGSNVPNVNTSWCAGHQTYCSLNKGAQAVFSVAGLPCPDMSRAGKKQKRAGPTSVVYMSHGHYHKQNRTPLLLVECTPVP